MLIVRHPPLPTFYFIQSIPAMVLLASPSIKEAPQVGLGVDSQCYDISLKYKQKIGEDYNVYPQDMAPHFQLPIPTPHGLPVPLRNLPTLLPLFREEGHY